MARLFAFVAALTAVGVLAGCGTSRHVVLRPSTGTTTTSTSPTVGPGPLCASSALAVWIGLGEGGGTAGATVYPLELTNIRPATCHLRGFPGVSAWAGHQLGSAASRDPAIPVRTVILPGGITVHALLSFTDVGNFSAASCQPKTATALRVYPPGLRTARFVPFSFQACSKPGPAFLSVRAVEPGVGVPGYTQ